MQQVAGANHAETHRQPVGDEGDTMPQPDCTASAAGSHHKPNWLGKPAAEMRADAQAHSDQQPITQRCLFCNWHWTGLAAAGRLKALAHREKKHPETIGRKTYRKRGATTGWRRTVSDDVIEGNNRARAEREEADKLATIERGRIRREQAA